MILGAILAGGEGRRMGGAKGGLLLEGRSLVARSRAILAPLVGTLLEDVVVVQRPGAAPGDHPMIHDRIPGRGPVGGLHAALHHARERRLAGTFLLACDLPLVPTAWVIRILEEAAGGRTVLPLSAGPLGYEPLCSFYPVEALGPVEMLLAEGGAGRTVSMVELVERLEPTVRVDPGPAPAGRGGEPHPGPFLNVNRPGDLERAARYLRGG